MSSRPAPNYAFIIACSNLQIVGLILCLHDQRIIGAALAAIAGTALFATAHRDHVRRNR